MDIISEKEEEKIYASGNGQYNYIWTVSNIGRYVKSTERTWEADVPPVWKVTSMMGFLANVENPQIMTKMQCSYDHEGRKDSIRIESLDGVRIKKYEYDYEKIILSEGMNVEEILGTKAYIEGEAVVCDRIIFQDKVYFWDEQAKVFATKNGEVCTNQMLAHPNILSKFLERITELEKEANKPVLNKGEDIF